MNNKDKERLISEIYDRIKKTSFQGSRLKRGGGTELVDTVYLEQVHKILSEILNKWLINEKTYLLKVRYALSGVKVFKVKTDNVYRIIGKFYSSSLEHIERIDYSDWTPEREQFWIDEGFEINGYREPTLSEDERK